MKTFTESLNFSTETKHKSHVSGNGVGIVEVSPRQSTNGNELLSLYCANNGIDPSMIDDNDWFSACETYENYMRYASAMYDAVYFWIDND